MKHLQHLNRIMKGGNKQKGEQKQKGENNNIDINKENINNNNENNENNNSSSRFKKIINWSKANWKGITGGATTPILVNTASTAIISGVGFTPSGVAAGSVAAGIQAGMGGLVASGGWFATFQSMGALGVGILGSAVVPLAVGGAILVPLYPYVKNYYYPKKEENLK